MDTVGPITRTAADAALVMNVIAGFDPRDNVTVKIPADDYSAELEKGVRGMRIGISPDMMKITLMDDAGGFGSHEIDPEIRAAVDTTAGILEE